MSDDRENTINLDNVSDFWRHRSTKAPAGDPLSLVWFDTDPGMQAERVAQETRLVLDKMQLEPSFKVLDLGGGYGRWSLRFAPHVDKVVCVEFQDAFLERGKEYAKAAGIANIDFIKDDVKNFSTEEKFDRIFLAGILQYLNDEDLEKVLQTIQSNLSENGAVFLIEPSSVLTERFVIDNKYSEALGANYSALYRTPDEFAKAFRGIGLKCAAHQNMFPEGSPHNKFPETRLRIYRFER